jgi:hypothetical protein
MPRARRTSSRRSSVEISTEEYEEFVRLQQLHAAREGGDTGPPVTSHEAGEDGDAAGEAAESDAVAASDDEVQPKRRRQEATINDPDSPVLSRSERLLLDLHRQQTEQLTGFFDSQFSGNQDKTGRKADYQRALKDKKDVLATAYFIPVLVDSAYDPNVPRDHLPCVAKYSASSNLAPLYIEWHTQVQYMRWQLKVDQGLREKGLTAPVEFAVDHHLFVAEMYSARPEVDNWLLLMKYCLRVCYRYLQTCDPTVFTKYQFWYGQTRLSVAAYQALTAAPAPPTYLPDATSLMTGNATIMPSAAHTPLSGRSHHGSAAARAGGGRGTPGITKGGGGTRLGSSLVGHTGGGRDYYEYPPTPLPSYSHKCFECNMPGGQTGSHPGKWCEKRRQRLGLPPKQ